MPFIDYPSPSGKPRAIQTEFDGYKFRSRLEARWALFFRMMHIDFAYEEEGFELDAGRYLPDFFLPDVEVYVEVKPASFARKMGPVLSHSKLYSVSEDRDVKRAFELASGTGSPVKFACGDPVDDFCRRGTEPGDPDEIHDWSNYPSKMICPLNTLRQAAYDREWQFHYALARGPLVTAALNTRQARFEFGETP